MREMRAYHVAYFGDNNIGPLLGSMTIRNSKKRLTSDLMREFRKTIEDTGISNVVIINIIPLEEVHNA